MFRCGNEMSMAEPATRPDGYQKRIVDPEIERYLNLFGAVEISGTRWCGKTWSSLAHGSSVTYVDRGANLMLVQADPSFALSGEKPHVIDEWQLVPPVWDVVRHAVECACLEYLRVVPGMRVHRCALRLYPCPEGCQHGSDRSHPT